QAIAGAVPLASHPGMPSCDRKCCLQVPPPTTIRPPSTHPPTTNTGGGRNGPLLNGGANLTVSRVRFYVAQFGGAMPI
ncbi:hypothetical protein EVAR_69149_1, partial [Eumeta japonica]